MLSFLSFHFFLNVLQRSIKLCITLVFTYGQSFYEWINIGLNLKNI